MKSRVGLAYLIFGLVALTASCITLALYFISIKALKATIATAELSRAEKSYDVVDAVIDEYSRRLSSIAKCLEHHTLLNDALFQYSQTGAIEPLKKIMNSICTEMDVDLFQIADLKERVVYRVHDPKHNGDTPNIWGVAEALAGKNIVTTTNNSSKGWSIRAIAPSIRNGKVIGALTVGYRLNDGFARKVNVGPNHIMIYSLDGLIAQSYESAPIYLDTTKDRDKKIIECIKENKIFNIENTKIHVNHYYKRLNIADATFGMIVEIDTSQSHLQFLQTEFQIASISVAIFLFAMLLSYGVTRRLLIPLQELRRQSDMTIMAITGVPHDRQSGNELDSLVSSFNMMRDMLLAKITRIEQAEHELQTNQKNLEILVKELGRKNQKLKSEVDERQRAEIALKNIHRELMDASRRAGMAQVATDVLHNVGNVLNSINVTAGFIGEKIQASKIANIQKTIEMMMQHLDDIDRFFHQDPKGKHIPVYLTEATAYMVNEQALVQEKLKAMVQNIDHIKNIVRMQQAYSKMSGIKIEITMPELINDAVQINSASLKHHNIELVVETNEIGTIEVDRQRILQILINLIDNAKDALIDCDRTDKTIRIKVWRQENPREIRIEVSDNGSGIKPEDLEHVFEHGFTTKETGHGFGLHSSVLAAMEMGGKLSVASKGAGCGATFTLELPE